MQCTTSIVEMIQSLKIIIKKASSYSRIRSPGDKTRPKTVTSKRRTNKTRMKDIGMPIALASGLGSAIVSLMDTSLAWKALRKHICAPTCKRILQIARINYLFPSVTFHLHLGGGCDNSSRCGEGSVASVR